ncbi:hypothetical protein MHYP_G00310140 [Metynnis hypsauchen]
MTLITIFIWMLVTHTLGSLGQVVVTQTAAKSAQPGHSVTTDCKSNTVVHRNEQREASKGRYYTSWYFQKPGEEQDARRPACERDAGSQSLDTGRPAVERDAERLEPKRDRKQENKWSRMNEQELWRPGVQAQEKLMDQELGT